MKIIYNVSNKTFVAEPYPRVNFVQYAKRNQNFAPFCGRTQSHSSYRGIFLVHQFCKKIRLKWHLQKILFTLFSILSGVLLRLTL